MYSFSWLDSCDTMRGKIICKLDSGAGVALEQNSHRTPVLRPYDQISAQQLQALLQSYDSSTGHGEFENFDLSHICSSLSNANAFSLTWVHWIKRVVVPKRPSDNPSPIQTLNEQCVDQRHCSQRLETVPKGPKRWPGSPTQSSLRGSWVN